MRMISQFEVAGQELAPFIGTVKLIRRYTWRMFCLRRKESEEAFAIIQRAIAEAEDPERIPVKVDWEDTVGLIEIDDSHEDAFIVDFEETQFTRYSAQQDGGRVVSIG